MHLGKPARRERQPDALPCGADDEELLRRHPARRPEISHPGLARAARLSRLLRLRQLPGRLLHALGPAEEDRDRLRGRPSWEPRTRCSRGTGFLVASSSSSGEAAGAVAVSDHADPGHPAVRGLQRGAARRAGRLDDALRLARHEYADQLVARLWRSTWASTGSTTLSTLTDSPMSPVCSVSCLPGTMATFWSLVLVCVVCRRRLRGGGRRRRLGLHGGRRGGVALVVGTATACQGHSCERRGRDGRSREVMGHRMSSVVGAEVGCLAADLQPNALRAH